MTEHDGLERSSELLPCPPDEGRSMSRTGLDAATLAKSLRRIAGDGSAEWVMEPMQARVLLDVADALDERDRLRERVAELDELLPENGRWYRAETVDAYVAENAKLRELVEDTLPVIENNCAMCAYLDECTILVDCKCIALKRLRDRMRELGGRRRVEEKE